MRRGIIGLCAAATLLLSCKGLETQAREDFGKKYSCPDARVTSKERKDLDPNVSIGGPRNHPKPPAEVAADPGRLAKWNEDQAKQNALSDNFYSDYTMYEVSGCDHTQIMGCRRGKSFISCRDAR